MINASTNGFELILPLGQFEITNPLPGENYNQVIMNYALNWRFADAEVNKKALLKLEVKHGKRRTMPTEIYAIVENDLPIKYHRTFLLPLWWNVGQTHLMIRRNEVMCERNAYVAYIKNLRANLQVPAQQYRILKTLENREPDVCMRVPQYIGECNKASKSRGCQFATGDQITAFQRVGLLLDPRESEPFIPQGEICFLANVSESATQLNTLPSNNITIFGIKNKINLKESSEQPLISLDKLMRIKGRDRYMKMSRDMGRLEKMIDAIRRIKIKQNNWDLLFARYNDKYITTRGKESQRWRQQVNTVQEQRENLKRLFRRNEQTISNQVAKEGIAIQTFYLYKRIRLILPHLRKLNQFKEGVVYSITIRAGDIIMRELYKYQQVNGTKSLTMTTTTKSRLPLSWQPHDDSITEARLLPEHSTKMMPEVTSRELREPIIASSVTKKVVLIPKYVETHRKKTRDDSIINTMTTQKRPSAMTKKTNRMTNEPTAISTTTPNMLRTSVNSSLESRNQNKKETKTMQPVHLITTLELEQQRDRLYNKINESKDNMEMLELVEIKKDEKLIVKDHAPTNRLNNTLTIIGILIGVTLTLGMGYKIRSDVKKLKSRKQLKVARGILRKQGKLENQLKKRVSFTGTA